MAHWLEQVYPFVPVFVQNAGISLYGLLWRRERLGGRFAEQVEGFRRREQWNRERFAGYLERELQRVLCQAFEHVPYYRQAWRKCGWTRGDLSRFTPDELPLLPVTIKEHLRATPEAFVAEDVAARQRLHRYFSSGSTGTPITAICTSEDHRRFIAAREARSFAWAGTTLLQPRSMIGGRRVVPRGVARPPFHRYNRAERQVYLSAYHIAPGHVRDYVEAFHRYQPRVLTGYAHSHYQLARMMNEQGVQLDYEPDAAVLCSEKLTREMKLCIQQAFRTRACEEYGAVENCALATECEQGRLHVHPDFGIVEIVDDDGVPVPPGVPGRVLCTGLLNEAQPLIRYEIGDLAAWAREPCGCGRNHLPVLEELIGRLEDVIVGPDGREMVRFHWVFIDLPGVREGQIIQERLDALTVRVVADERFGFSAEEIIRERFRERLGPVSVQIERVAEIPKSERGKFRAVISKLPPETRKQALRNRAA